ncbi:MAG: hypothetical protein A2508_09150 [Candidatus Lambdaproteobacteria bacterium RIFOXYD12_FULL_49_8]|uniref:Peptidase S49 domain-containing protein n=1 Tax=Candidatus Lambdaproteobacteria bacterium RIFOXYD2_FULL_50_16 TaxID=1817772 RepID=A0A1F6GGE0_9PROT|nr:MAG: hypothetical protein A2527_10230 [Candidatus Lambdaproteobacteria bacterium RIFOXYD2_FULL_50_16]OGG97624.1 MAG: hypothetical protein A2508_09150 [Candidatus Lambdaproteobacteria bacterium RIFOXYD12_FULL_49_8]
MALPFDSSSFWQRHPWVRPLLVLALLLWLAARFSNQALGPQIGVLAIEGVILDSESLLNKIKTLEEEERVSAVLVRINSPGGGAASSQEIFGALKRLGAKKPVYASVSSVAASGGYYVALSAKKIYANPASLMGSIGVILQSLNVSEAFGKLGLKMETIKAGKNKDIGNMFRPMSEEERQLLSGVLSDVHDQFIGAIVENRPLSEAEVRALADGRIFTGRQALEAKLIDGLLGFEEVVSLITAEVGLERAELYYPKDTKRDLMERLGLEEASHFLEGFKTQGLILLDPKLR